MSKAIAIHDPEQMQRDSLFGQLRLSCDMAVIAEILNGIERRQAGLEGCALGALPLSDMQRLIGKATAIVRAVDPEVEVDAIDEVAHVICEGADAEYAPFEHQSPAMHAKYRRWAEIAIKAYWISLEGRSR